MASRKDLSITKSDTDAAKRESPEPSCVSMKSHQSILEPVQFTSGDSSADISVIQRESSEPSCVSMKSHQSMPEPIQFTSGDSSADMRNSRDGLKSSTGKQKLDFIFMELEHKIISVMKKELKRFKRLLSPDYSDCSDREEEEDEGQNRVREGVLKITLQILRNMNQKDVANKLQTQLVSVYQQKLKSRLRQTCDRINEGITGEVNPTLLNEIYTELYITEGGSGDVNTEHEVRQIQTASRRQETEETPIHCNDIFKALPGQDKPIRTVLTKGVAGIGKTVSVQKFIVDWAEGKANQDVHFIFPLPFRELNLMKKKNLSLMEILHNLFKEVKEMKSIDYHDIKIIFIFDGLDECQFPLDFQNNYILWNVTEPAPVDVLLTNLIKGNLLPSARIWITSRPAAANQIPPECVDQVTEIRGFNDPQKEEYFRKRIKDQSLANKIITHIKSSRSLYIMCHIPVFCWISASVLERMLGESEHAEVPRTLTQMFTHFLIFQTKLKTQKYDGKYEVDLHQARESFLLLGKLAFQQLKKGNLIFYEDDLKECGIDVKEASVYSGVCTQIFRKEYGLGKVYCFIHLSIQEFLAALFQFLTKSQHKKHKSNITDFLKSEVDKVLNSDNGHLDLYLRFILGLSLESNQSLLRGLLAQTESSSDSKQKIVKYIKMKIWENPSPEKTINLFYCLNELNDQFLVQEVQTYLSRTDDSFSGVRLSPDQWSALVFVSLNSEEDLDEFKLSKYHPSEECLLRLLPMVKASRKADLSFCSLTEKSCSALASALSSNSSSLRELNLSHNNLQDSGVKLLSAGLENPNCQLETLNLTACNMTEKSCLTLTSALSSSVRVLNLSNNDLQDSGVKLLSDGLKNPHCKVETLELSKCGIELDGFGALTSALKSNPSHLTELNLNHNYPGDPGVKLLSDLLEYTQCKLKKLELSNCSIGEEGFAALASVLRSNPSHLRELNLNNNEPADSGVKLLSDPLKDPDCKLEKLHLSNCSIGEEGFAAFASALRSNPSHLRELNLTYNKPGDSGVKLLSDLLKDPNCKLEKLELYNSSIGEEGFAALASALRSNPSHLRELDLKYNRPEDSGVKLLSALLAYPQCKLEKLELSHCNIGVEGFSALASALRSNPSHMRELNLNWNKPGDSGVKLLSDLLRDPNCKLEKLELSGCSIEEEGISVLASALRSNPSHLRELNLNSNKLGDTGVKLLSDVLKEPRFKLEKLQLSACSIEEKGFDALASALKSSYSNLNELNLNNNDPGDSGEKLLSDLQKNPHCKLKKLHFNRPQQNKPSVMKNKSGLLPRFGQQH